MGGYVFVTSPCGSCGGLFSYNPNFVPSLNNNAFCESCMTGANAKREEMGLPAHPIHPQAYEPLPEEELR